MGYISAFLAYVNVDMYTYSEYISLDTHTRARADVEVEIRREKPFEVIPARGRTLRCHNSQRLQPAERASFALSTLHSCGCVDVSSTLHDESPPKRT